MQGLILVARAHGALKDWEGVAGVLTSAERVCKEATAVAEMEAADGPDGDVTRYPPPELYEMVARSLAMSGMWEEAASAVRRLEVQYACGKLGLLPGVAWIARCQQYFLVMRSWGGAVVF